MGKRLTAVVLVTASVIVAANAAATAASTDAHLTVHQTNAVTSLFPGGPPEVLRGTFDNPGDRPVFVHDVTAVVSTFRVQTDPTKPACTEADFDIGGVATVDSDVPVGQGVGSWEGLTVALVRTSADQDNCQGVSITIEYRANAT